MSSLNDLDNFLDSKEADNGIRTDLARRLVGRQKIAIVSRLCFKFEDIFHSTNSFIYKTITWNNFLVQQKYIKDLANSWRRRRRLQIFCQHSCSSESRRGRRRRGEKKHRKRRGRISGCKVVQSNDHVKTRPFNPGNPFGFDKEP